jgi:DNA-directed RNA polymerase specialized sigma subunit
MNEKGSKKKYVDSEQDALVLRAQAGDPQAVREVVQQFDALCKMIADQQRVQQSLTSEDGDQLAIEGLLKAVRMYDPQRGHFSRYVGRTIRHFMWGVDILEGTLVRLPGSRTLSSDVRDRVRDVHHYGGVDKQSIEDMLPSEDDPLTALFEDEHTCFYVHRAVQHCALNPTQRKILKWVYGFSVDSEGRVDRTLQEDRLTVAEAGIAIGVSKAAAWDSHRRALILLREQLKKEGWPPK